MCASCFSGTIELLKQITPLQEDGRKLKKQSQRREREIMIHEATGNLCSEINFFDYTGFPPSYVKACKAFLDEYNDDSVVEERLFEGGEPEAAAERVCKEVCEGFSYAQKKTSYAPPSEIPKDANIKTARFGGPDEDSSSGGSSSGSGKKKGKGKGKGKANVKAQVLDPVEEL